MMSPACRNSQRVRGLKALDLFCGGGGAALGLIAAGFEVIVGIDIEDHSRSYPGMFLQGDALEAPFDLAEFDLVWASPPCQAYSVATPKHLRDSHPALIEATREMLAGHPLTVIENVMRSPLRPDLVLDGPMFGLDRIERRRQFELSWPALSPTPYRIHRDYPPAPVYKHMTYQTETMRRWLPNVPDLKWRLPVWEAKEVMGIPAESPMTGLEIGEAVPPVFAEYIGRLAIDKLIAGRTGAGVAEQEGNKTWELTPMPGIDDRPER